MAKGKNTFTAYVDWIHIFDELTDEDAGKLVKHLLNYVNDKDPETDNPLIKVAFAPIKTILKKDLKKWESICKRNSKAAKKRWDADACERMQVDTKSTKNADKDNDKDNDKEDSKIPTIDSFINYAVKVCEQLNIYVSDGKIRNKYHSWKENDWKNGYGKPIKNWKTTIRNTLPHLKEKKPINFEDLTAEERLKLIHK